MTPSLPQSKNLQKKFQRAVAFILPEWFNGQTFLDQRAVGTHGDAAATVPLRFSWRKMLFAQVL
jgi:hypothetical protein